MSHLHYTKCECLCQGDIMNNKRLTEDQKKEIISLYKQNYTIKAISERVGCSCQSVNYNVAKQGISRKKGGRESATTVAGSYKKSQERNSVLTAEVQYKHRGNLQSRKHRRFSLLWNFYPRESVTNTVKQSSVFWII